MPNHEPVTSYQVTKIMRQKKFVFFLFSVLCFLILDQSTKAYFASRVFSFGPLDVKLTPNSSLPFTLDLGSIVNLIIILVFLGVFIYLFFLKEYSSKIEWGPTLVLSGAIGNLIDRIRFGYVRDFLDVGLGFVFNLADIIILLGILIILIQQTPKLRGKALIDGRNRNIMP